MKILLNEKAVCSTIKKMAQAIFKAHPSLENMMIVGLQTRGVIIAHRIRDFLAEIPLGTLDANLYRDDLATISEIPLIRKTEILKSIKDQGVILVDDVLYTGRTIRAALDALMDLGRPRFIELAVLIDRGGRELPIQPHYTGLGYQTAPGEEIQVMFQETDGREGVGVKAYQERVTEGK